MKYESLVGQSWGSYNKKEESMEKTKKSSEREEFEKGLSY